MQVLALNVRRLRSEAGWSQTELAQRTGLSQTWISRLEAGRENPTLETIQRLAEALERNLIELFEQQVA